jgi:hypothetical protein
MSARLKSAVAEMDAEDRAIRFLDTLTRPVAATTAVKTAVELYSAWEIEKREMVQRGDPRRVYLLSIHDLSWLLSEAAERCQSQAWGICPVEDLRPFLADLPEDVAAFVAHKAARWACSRLT